MTENHELSDSHRKHWATGLWRKLTPWFLLKNCYEVNIHIEAGGLEVDDAKDIHSLLAKHSDRITVQVDGVPVSAASMIAMAGDELRVNMGSGR